MHTKTPKNISTKEGNNALSRSVMIDNYQWTTFIHNLYTIIKKYMGYQFYNYVKKIITH